jgi:hypothetical protein
MRLASVPALFSLAELKQRLYGNEELDKMQVWQHE